MRRPPKAVIDTGLFVEHLRGTRSPSTLRLAAAKLFCYTTVVQAAELFALARSARERRAAAGALGAVRVLGLPAATAPRAARVLRRRREALPSLIAALCIESRLPIVTTRVGAFRRYRGLRVVPAHLVRASGSGRQILQAAGRLSRDPARSVRW